MNRGHKIKLCCSNDGDLNFIRNGNVCIGGIRQISFVTLSWLDEEAMLNSYSLIFGNIVMKTLLLLVASLAISNAAWAEQKPSVMFGDTPRSISETVPETSAREAKCMQMKQEIDNLKGKPLRRSALDERFRAECGHKQPITDEQPYQGGMQGQTGN